MDIRVLHPKRLFPPGAARFGYIYLLNLVIPATFLTLVPTGLLRTFGAVAIVAFGLSYIASYWLDERGRVLCIGFQIALMVVMTVVLSPGYSSMFFYPAALVGLLRRPYMQAGFALLVASGLGAVLIPVFVHHEHVALPYWAMMLAGVLIAMATTGGVYVSTERNRSQAALHRANEEIERLATIAERERITQDLHDVMGHDLSMITLKAQLLGRLIDRDPNRARQEAQDIEDAARQALTRVREYIAESREPNLPEEWRAAEHLLRAAGMAVESEGEESLPELRSECAQALAMCLREAVTNTVRHSSAEHVRLSCTRLRGELVVVLVDDGRGIEAVEDARTAGDPEARTARLPLHGNGLNGIRARLAAVGGSVHICSNGRWLTPRDAGLRRPIEAGTRVSMRVPCPGDVQ